VLPGNVRGAGPIPEAKDQESSTGLARGNDVAGDHPPSRKATAGRRAQGDEEENLCLIWVNLWQKKSDEVPD
jgi:hypothetical protein